MIYRDVWEGVFLSRPNRFVARVLIEGKEEVVHVKNTGRCRELLLPGAKVYLERATGDLRKTRFDLIAVEKETLKGTVLFNIDSQAPNQLVAEWLSASGIPYPRSTVKREVRFGDSRFDFMLKTPEESAYLEVKGVTLERQGQASFPDAPTLRGAKHLRELMKAKKDGFAAFVFFVLQFSGAESISPNEENDPLFAKTLREAVAAGVEILSYECEVYPDRLWIKTPVPVLL